MVVYQLIINNLMVFEETQRISKKWEGKRQETSRKDWILTPSQCRDEHLRYLFFSPKNLYSRTKILKLVQVVQPVEVIMFFLHNSMEYIFYDIVYFWFPTYKNTHPLEKNLKT